MGFQECEDPVRMLGPVGLLEQLGEFSQDTARRVPMCARVGGVGLGGGGLGGVVMGPQSSSFFGCGRRTVLGGNIRLGVVDGLGLGHMKVPCANWEK